MKVEPDEVDAGSPPKKKDAIVRGVLSVTVIAAENLPATDFLGKADPYVVLTMKKSDVRYKTRVSEVSLSLMQILMSLLDVFSDLFCCGRF